MTRTLQWCVLFAVLLLPGLAGADDSTNSDPPKPRAEVFYEMVRKWLVGEHTAKVTHPGE